MCEPSFSRKLRTAPTRSPGSAPSMALVDTAGCQSAWPLKSRKAAQSSSAVALITVEQRISTIASAGEAHLERGKPGRKYIAADRLDQAVLPIRRGVELGGPLGESMIDVGDRDQPEGGDVVLDAHRAFQDRIFEGH